MARKITQSTFTPGMDPIEQYVDSFYPLDGGDALDPLQVDATLYAGLGGLLKRHASVYFGKHEGYTLIGHPTQYDLGSRRDWSVRLEGSLGLLDMEAPVPPIAELAKLATNGKLADVVNPEGSTLSLYVVSTTAEQTGSHGHLFYEVYKRGITRTADPELSYQFQGTAEHLSHLNDIIQQI